MPITIHINPTAPTSHGATDGDDADLANTDLMPYDASDIDSAQLRGRYDARLLSENISGYRSEVLATTADEEATSCRNSNAKYVHGQKVSRFTLIRLGTYTHVCRPGMSGQ